MIKLLYLPLDFFSSTNFFSLKRPIYDASLLHTGRFFHPIIKFYLKFYVNSRDLSKILDNSN